jgi:hypothetical protein
LSSQAWPEPDRELLKSVARWLSFEISRRELLDRWANLSLYPETVPLSQASLELVMALLREVIRGGGEPGGGEEETALVVTDEILAKLPHQGLAVLTVIDALQPAGVVPLIHLEKGKEEENLLGTLIAFTQVQDDEIAASVSVQFNPEETTEIEVPSGELLVLPIGGEGVEIKVRCRSCELSGRKAAVVDAVGGAVGIILDTRDRPISFPEDEEERRAVIGRWLKVFL